MNKKTTRIPGILLFILPLLLLPGGNLHAKTLQVIGWIENVAVNGNDLKLKAKIDTGATSSSINAKILKKFKRNGDKWVRFQVKNKSGKKIVFEKQITRMVKIKRKLALSLKRPVVVLGVCIGNVYQEHEVNLSNRSNFNYEMLIGRNYLEGHFLVDSSKTFTVKPGCK